MEERKITQVVAALIWDGPRFLVCRRPPEKKRGMLWEFVGGKVEPGETKRDALIRECREELDITVEPDSEFITVMHEYPDIKVELTLFSARIREGTPKLLEHTEMAWITADECDRYDFCPADTDILKHLKKIAGHLVTAEAGGIFAAAMLPDTDSDTVIYLHEDFASVTAVRELLSSCLPIGKMPVLVPVEGIDWDRDLSPWAADGVFRGQRFSGGAPEYLIRFAEVYIPDLERKLPTPPKRRILAGYSLAGLFALWSGFQTDLFCGIASVSGSLWYDGFVDFVRERSLSPSVKSVYLSLGDKEKNAKNPRMAMVETVTSEIARLLREKTGLAVPFELNPGGHFRDVSERIAKGLNYLIEHMED